MKNEQVSISELRQHPDYIRGQQSKSVVSEYAQVIRDSGWVFTAIELQPVPSTEKIYQEEGIRYYIIDGTHRIAAAIEAEYSKKIPAKIHPPLTALDAIALQIKANMAHGIRLSHAAQTNAIKKLKELGMNGKTIAEKTGLSTSSVSRIISEKQRDTASGAPGNVDKSGQAKKTAKPFKTEDWFKLLGKVLKGWEKHGAKIRRSAGFPEGWSAAFDNLLETMNKK